MLPRKESSISDSESRFCNFVILIVLLTMQYWTSSYIGFNCSVQLSTLNGSHEWGQKCMSGMRPMQNKSRMCELEPEVLGRLGMLSSSLGTRKKLWHVHAEVCQACIMHAMSVHHQSVHVQCACVHGSVHVQRACMHGRVPRLFVMSLKQYYD